MDDSEGEELVLLIDHSQPHSTDIHSDIEDNIEGVSDIDALEESGVAKEKEIRVPVHAAIPVVFGVTTKWVHARDFQRLEYYPYNIRFALCDSFPFLRTQNFQVTVITRASLGSKSDTYSYDMDDNFEAFISDLQGEVVEKLVLTLDFDEDIFILLTNRLKIRLFALGLLTFSLLVLCGIGGNVFTFFMVLLILCSFAIWVLIPETADYKKLFLRVLLVHCGLSCLSLGLCVSVLTFFIRCFSKSDDDASFLIVRGFTCPSPLVFVIVSLIMISHPCLMIEFVAAACRQLYLCYKKGHESLRIQQEAEHALQADTVESELQEGEDVIKEDDSVNKVEEE